MALVKKNGYEEVLFSNGNLFYRGNYNDGNRIGCWEYGDYHIPNLILKIFYL